MDRSKAPNEPILQYIKFFRLTERLRIAEKSKELLQELNPQPESEECPPASLRRKHASTDGDLEAVNSVIQQLVNGIDEMKRDVSDAREYVLRLCSHPQAGSDKDGDGADETDGDNQNGLPAGTDLLVYVFKQVAERSIVDKQNELELLCWQKSLKLRTLKSPGCEILAKPLLSRQLLTS